MYRKYETDVNCRNVSEEIALLDEQLERSKKEAKDCKKRTNGMLNFNLYFFFNVA